MSTATERYQAKLAAYRERLAREVPAPVIAPVSPTPLVVASTARPVLPPVRLSSGTALFQHARQQRGTLRLISNRSGSRWYGRFSRYTWQDGKRTVKGVGVWLGDQSIGKREAQRRLEDAIRNMEIAWETLSDEQPKARRVITDRIKIGAASELLVSADLLLKGFEVFRSVSHTCSCDLIALRDAHFFRVEVKTSDLDGLGKAKCNLQAQAGRFDLAAIVRPNGEIAYLPTNDDIARLVGSTPGNSPEPKHRELSISQLETAHCSDIEFPN